MNFPILYISGPRDGHVGLLALENRKKYFKKLGISESQVVSMHLTHSTNVSRVGKKDGGKLFEETDALITDSQDIYLALPVGDCLPIAVYDSATNSAGIIHGGWRGLAGGIIKNSIYSMKNEFGSDTPDLTIYIGAHICQKHYEVKNDVSRIFKKYKGAVKHLGEKEFLDLGKVAKLQLLELGIKEKNIRSDPRCTFEDPSLYSFRGGDKVSRNLYLLTLGK